MTVRANIAFRLYVGYYDPITKEALCNYASAHSIKSDGQTFDYPLTDQNQGAAIVTFALLCPEGIRELEGLEQDARDFLNRYYSHKDQAKFIKVGPHVISGVTGFQKLTDVEGYASAHLKPNNPRLY